MSKPAHPSLAYKVLTGPQWAQFQADGVFKGAPVDLADGYIHLSTTEQVTETVDKHFAGQTDLHIVAVDLVVLGDAVRWEPSRGGQLFPHIYADLPLGACPAHSPLQRGACGTVILP
ncbi:DUF952 domain-containing protein [Novosphingobium sp.]|uniref:DUF952 domain-containing protein n=1 Tax=Novosphingobium sp. TaxID=1874826 RepID=UPI0038BD6061